MRCLVVAGGTAQDLDAFEDLPLGTLRREAILDNVVGGLPVDNGAAALGTPACGPFEVLFLRAYLGGPPLWWPALDAEWPTIEHAGTRNYRVAAADGEQLEWIALAALGNPAPAWPFCGSTTPRSGSARSAS